MLLLLLRQNTKELLSDKSYGEGGRFNPMAKMLLNLAREDVKRRKWARGQATLAMAGTSSFEHIGQKILPEWSSLSS